MKVHRFRAASWFTAGIAVTGVAAWSLAAWHVEALPGASESTFVAITPVRILDSRDPVNLGLPGPFTSPIGQDLQVTGSIPTSAGTQIVVPAGSTGVTLNVTVVGPTAAGFVSVRPADAAGAPTTSSLNFAANETVPNAVTVSLPTAGADAGKIEITYDALGVAGPRTDILVDVVGYSTSAGLADLTARLVAAETNKISHGDVVISHGTTDLTPNSSSPATVQSFRTGATITSAGNIGMSLSGPMQLGGVNYGLKSVEYCIDGIIAPLIVTSVTISGGLPSAFNVVDNTDRNAAGCFSITVNNSSNKAFDIMWTTAGASGELRMRSVRTTWSPASTLPAAVLAPAQADDGDPTAG